MLSVSDVLTDSVTKIKTGTKYFVFMNGTCLNDILIRLRLFRVTGQKQVN